MEREAHRASTRRKDPRHPVDGSASLLLVHHGSEVSCRLVDLSLGGCQIRSEKPFLAGPMVRVEVVFQVVGESFRIAGVTQWTRDREWIGIRFLDLNVRKRAALTHLIAEIAEYNVRRGHAKQESTPEADADAAS